MPNNYKVTLSPNTQKDIIEARGVIEPAANVESLNFAEALHMCAQLQSATRSILKDLLPAMTGNGAMFEKEIRQIEKAKADTENSNLQIILATVNVRRYLNRYLHAETEKQTETK